MAERRHFSPSTLPPPTGYSQVVEAPAASVIYISGQVPLDVKGRLVGEGDIEAQTRQVFENLAAALTAAGAGWADVVKLNYFLRDVGALEAVRTVRDEYIDRARAPASTLVEVSRLFREDVLIEIDAVAVGASY